MADHEEKKEGGEGHAAHAGHGGGGGAHGGGSHEEHEGAPEWLISFADNVALMMGFFVILLAMNMGPKATAVQGGDPAEKAVGQESHELDFIISIREGFNNPVDIYSDKPEDQPLIRRIIERQGGLGIQSGPPGRHPALQAIRPDDYSRITASIAFDDRSAILSGASRQVVAQVAIGLRDQRWIIEVRGHVSPFESMHNQLTARQLSYDRAMAVAMVLVESGLKWENMRIVACGDSNRLIPRTFDRDADRPNQRVELVVTNETVPADPYTRETLPGAAPAAAAPAQQAGDH